MHRYFYACEQLACSFVNKCVSTCHNYAETCQCADNDSVEECTCRGYHALTYALTCLSSGSRDRSRSKTSLVREDTSRNTFLHRQCECGSGSSSSAGRSDNHIFDEAVEWLERNFSSRIHMDRLIDHIGYSRPMFFDLFKRQTNMTPGEFLRNYRIKKAKEMLLRTDMPALDVGKACGLGAPAHFSRLFKKMTGLTPLAYRQRKSHPSRSST